jgi:hypothetical protein
MELVSKGSELSWLLQTIDLDLVFFKAFSKVQQFWLERAVSKSHESASLFYLPFCFFSRNWNR